MLYDEHGYICPYNEECRCQIADCDSCGWNPSVKEKRLERIMENMGLKHSTNPFIRLINADDYLDLLDEAYEKTRKLIQRGETHLDNLAEGFLKASNVIRNMPTEDAAPVVHGRWIWNSNQNGERYAQCSRCECGYEEGLASVFDYCPMCGTKMDGKEVICQ